jgi:thymidylate kinase
VSESEKIARSAMREAGPETAARLHSEYARVFDALDEEGILYCMLRPFIGLEELSGDLDLLISPDQRIAAERLLQALGFEILRTGRFIPGKVGLVRWSGSAAVMLDLHYAVVVRGLEYLDARRVIAAASRRYGVPVASDADLALILLVHDVVGKRRLQHKYGQILLSLWPLVPSSAAFDDAREHGYADLLPKSIQDVTAVMESTIGQQLGDELQSRLLRIRANRRRHRRLALLRRLPTRGSGISIALYGPDGSGKSSTIEHLRYIFANQLNWRVSTVYMGPWGHDVLAVTSRFRSAPPPSLRDLLTRRRGVLSGGARRPRLTETLRLEMARRSGSLSDQGEERRRLVRETALPWIAFRWIRGHLHYLCFMAVLALELRVRYRRVRRLVRHGHVVLCDRYAHDLLTGEMHNINRRYSWVRRIVCALVPLADINVLLWNDPDVLLSRKKQLSPARLRAFLDFYENLAGRYGFERVLTDDPPIVVARRIVGIIFSRAVARRKT